MRIDTRDQYVVHIIGCVSLTIPKYLWGDYVFYIIILIVFTIFFEPSLLTEFVMIPLFNYIFLILLVKQMIQFLFLCKITCFQHKYNYVCCYFLQEKKTINMHVGAKCFKKSPWLEQSMVNTHFH